MFRTSFLAAAGASRIPVHALRKGFLHSRKGGSRPLCPHDGRLPQGGVRGYYLKKRQELYRVRIFFQEWFRILLIRLSDAEFPYKKKISAKSPSKEPSAKIFFHGRGKAVAGSAVSCQSHPTSRINTTALEYAGNLTENPFPMSSAPVTVTSMRPSVSVRRYVAVGRKP